MENKHLKEQRKLTKLLSVYGLPKGLSTVERKAQEKLGVLPSSWKLCLFMRENWGGEVKFSNMMVLPSDKADQLNEALDHMEQAHIPSEVDRPYLRQWYKRHESVDVIDIVGR
jgi:hypothetical protein